MTSVWISPLPSLSKTRKASLTSPSSSAPWLLLLQLLTPARCLVTPSVGQLIFLTTTSMLAVLGPSVYLGTERVTLLVLSLTTSASTPRILLWEETARTGRVPVRLPHH